MEGSEMNIRGAINSVIVSLLLVGGIIGFLYQLAETLPPDHTATVSAYADTH